MIEEHREVSFSLTRDSAQKISKGLEKVAPGDIVTIEALDTKLKINIKNDQKSRAGNIKALLCWLRGIFTEEHDYREIETYNCKQVTVSKCQRCNKVEISWE